MKFRIIAVFIVAFFSGSSALHASCGAAFCAVNTNWNLQGLAAEPGWRLDLRYEYINQDQPRAGSSRVGIGQLRRHHDEVRTTNRNFLGTLDYTLDENWGVSVTAPVSDRSHTHIHNHHGVQLLEQWDFSRLGDVRVMGRYQMHSENTEQLSFGFYGLNFGLKLPTGARDVVNSAGDRAERSLQPGTGTTDILLGAYYNNVLLNADSSWFAQGLWQKALDSKENYRPGQRVTFDLGFRYEATDKLGLMLQLNALHRDKDRGTQAEPADTGGRFLFLSPGVSYAFAKGSQVYGFMQRALYQHVNGVQLTADWSFVAGISTRF